MKKRLLTLLIAMLIFIITVTPVFAESVSPLLADNADLLTVGEESELLSKLNKTSEEQQVDIVVVTVGLLGGQSPMDYADDFYDYNGYRKDGILLLVSMESRDCYISTKGYGITAFTDAGIDYILDEITPKLSDEKYADAFTSYAELCDRFITQARTGEPYDSGNLPKGPFKIFKNLLIALAVGLLAAFIVTSVMKGNLKTVRSQPAAAHYIKNGSVNITESRDLFLYRHVNRCAIPKNDNSGGSHTHVSSSGNVHGGGGRKF